MAQHDRFGFNATDTPADDAQPIDHRGVTVGSHQRIGHGHPAQRILAEKHTLGQHLQVHLVHDAHAGRYHAEVGKCALAPAEELVPLAIPLELEIDVRLQRVGTAEPIDLHRMIDDQVDRDEGIDSLRIATQALHGGAHRGQIHDGRYAREVLQHDARRWKRNLDLGQIGRRPAGQMSHVGLANHVTIAVAGHGFEQNADGKRQAGNGVPRPDLPGPTGDRWTPRLRAV